MMSGVIRSAHLNNLRRTIFEILQQIAEFVRKYFQVAIETSKVDLGIRRTSLAIDGNADVGLTPVPFCSGISTAQPFQEIGEHGMRIVPLLYPQPSGTYLISVPAI
jgi:hypothetical protein